MNVSITEFGAIGDGVTLNTAMIQNAINICSENGGGKVIVSGGIYMTGTLILKQNVNLHLAADGILLGSPHCEDYPERDNVCHVNTKRLPRWRNACLIYAEECSNISITGSGTIDCNGTSFVRKRERENNTPGWNYERIDAPTPPRAVFFAGCANIKIEDVTMINQPSGWSYWITDCDYVTFDKVKIIADVNYPNNDGIHINCSRNVSISNCHITCGDDCIIVRANSAALKENKVCERVVVNNCTLTSYSSAIRIAWLNDGVIRNCIFSNLVMTDCTVGIGIYLPYMESDPNNPGSADQGREATHIENLSFNHIIMDKTASTPIKIFIHPHPDVKCSAIRHIYFHDLHTKGPELPLISGRKENLIEDISFSDCSFEVTDGSEFDNLHCHGAASYTPSFQQMKLQYTKNITFHHTHIDMNR